MAVVLITGSSGLIGSEAVFFYNELGFDVVGIDNNLRGYFFGNDGSTDWNLDRIKKQCAFYSHHSLDIRDEGALESVFAEFSKEIVLIIHCAAQPSHDWASSEPKTDFSVNATGTLNLLEAYRKYCPEAAFVFTSTNKVYGDTPNRLKLNEVGQRLDVQKDSKWFNGVNEKMSIDASKHSLFGVSKASADLMVQEYGKYFGLNTVSFRGGCLTGPSHSGAPLHGFLSYLVKCNVTFTPYTIHGYRGLQVRDNIHSSDLIAAFHEFFLAPRSGEVYNIGGGRQNSCSIIEVIDIIEKISTKALKFSISSENRIGDHKWWITDFAKFQTHYPTWKQNYNLDTTIREMVEVQTHAISAK